MTAPTKARTGASAVEVVARARAAAAARDAAARDADARDEIREQQAEAEGSRPPVEVERWWPYGEEPPYVADPAVEPAFPCGCGTSDTQPAAGAGG